MSNYKTLSTKGKEIFTDVALHPGEILNDELKSREIKKIAFAEQIGMTAGHLSELLHVRRNMSAATAIKLEKLFDIPAEYWMRVQMHYDLFIERNKSAA
jgi:antitoxin HigA-1